MDSILALKTLCGSEARFRLLRHIYARPGDEYQLRPLAAAAGVDPGQAHKLIRQFAAVGLCEQIAPAPYPRYRASADPALSDALVKLFAAAQPSATPMQPIEERSLRLHRAAVRRLRQDPAALERARQTLRRWIARYGSEAPKALLEWEEILKKPVAQIAEAALQRTQYGDRIRKSSPLSTLASAQERKKAYAPR